ncbi:hypothetical protein MMC25_006628 [Agyrium rufum]|nr:hypothetical protein [Agyrium rufum]
MCKTFNNADVELAERTLRVKACWIRVGFQLEFITQQVIHLMKPKLAGNLYEVLETLSFKLERISHRLRGLTRRSFDDNTMPPKSLGRVLSDQVFRKFKYVATKEFLDQAISDLDVWRELFDPSWFLVMKMATPVLVDAISAQAHRKLLTERFPATAGLQEPVQENSPVPLRVFIAADDLDTREIIDPALSFSRVSIGRRKGKTYLLDPCEIPEGPGVAFFLKQVRAFATKLSITDPTMSNLLSCKGVIKDSPRYTFVFRIPDGMSEPHSLRAFLLRGFPLPLSTRFQIAKDLVKSALFVHSYGFVHKNIRPETIWLMHKNEDKGFFTHLLGFEHFRHEDGQSSGLGDDAWDMNIYRHPDRQGSSPEQLYKMQHDIYSVGVCLLEIGMWESLVLYGDDLCSVKPSEWLKRSFDTADKSVPAANNVVLLKMAQEILPTKMGDKFSLIVQTCLTCLEKDNADFGNTDDFEDEDGIPVGFRYIEKVLSRLNEIQV